MYKYDPKYIRKLRDLTGLTQKAFGERVGVTKTCVSQWEKGLQCPGAKSIAKLSNTYEVDPNYFLAEARND